MSTAEVVSRRPGTLVSLLALYRLLLRTQITVPRLLGIGALGALSIVIGVFASLDDNPAQAAADAVSGYGLGILVPLAALWLGTSAIGDLVEDKLLVYLSLKPVPRWQLPAAAIAGDGQHRRAADGAAADRLPPSSRAPATWPWATLLAASFAALAYAGLFVAAGLWFRRAVWWGLVFILIWENVAPTPQKARRASRCSAGRPPFSVWRPTSTCSSSPAPLPPRSSCSPRSRSQPGWPRPGATAAPISTRSSASGPLTTICVGEGR